MTRFAFVGKVGGLKPGLVRCVVALSYAACAQADGCGCTQPFSFPAPAVSAPIWVLVRSFPVLLSLQTGLFLSSCELVKCAGTVRA